MTGRRGQTKLSCQRHKNMGLCPWHPTLAPGYPTLWSRLFGCMPLHNAATASAFSFGHLVVGGHPSHLHMFPTYLLQPQELLPHVPVSRLLRGAPPSMMPPLE